jgi:hypothetical protein
MSSNLLEPALLERSSALDATDAATLSELDRKAPSDATPEWCDLSPEVEVTFESRDGFGTVRIY